MLSNTCKYAVRAVIYLAINEEPSKKIGIKQISKELDIPSPFLGKILQSLAKQKLLASTKGPHGGFSLGKPAENISLLDIVEIIDGLDVFNVCLVGMKFCVGHEERKTICPLHQRSGPIRNDLFEMFKNQTIGGSALDLKKVGNFIDL